MDINRRTFLTRSLGLGGACFIAPLSLDIMAGAPQKVGFLKDKLHYTPKVKRVIHLCMAGGMSHLESFDPKPELNKLNGKPMPVSFTKGQQLAQLQGKALKCLGNTHPFTKSPKPGIDIANIFPHMQKVAPD